MHNSRAPKEVSQIRTVIEEFDRRQAALVTDFDLRLDNPSGALNKLLNRLTQKIAAADISLLEREAGWWARFSGARLKDEVKLEREVTQIEQLLVDTRYASIDLKARLAIMYEQLEELKRAIESTRALLDWSERWLAKFQSQQESSDDWSLQRFETKIANQRAMLVSNQLHLQQLRMVTQNIEFQVDVHSELENKFYPVWKQYVSQLAMAEPPATQKRVKGNQVKELNRELKELLDSNGGERLT